MLVIKFKTWQSDPSVIMTHDFVKKPRIKTITVERPLRSQRQALFNAVVS